MTLTQLAGSPLFRVGLAIRLAAVVFLVPVIQVDWFTRFMVETLSAPSFDPWSTFLDRGGDPLAFPYGPAMYLAHAPWVGAGMLVDWILGLGGGLGGDQGTGAAVGPFAQIGFAASLLAADILLLLILCRLDGERSDRVLLFYWLSPLVLYITYWHGQTDLVPMVMLTLSLLMLKRLRIEASAIVLGLGVSAKLSTVIAVPFILLFLWKNKRYHDLAPKFVVTFAVTVLLGFGVFLLSPGLQTMLLSNPELGKIYDIAIPVTADQQIYVVPLCFLFLLYGAWRIGRMNFELMSAFLGVSFFIVLLLTPASVGWYLWVVPFLVAYQLRASLTGNVMVLAFSLVFVLVKALVSTGPLVPLLDLDLSAPAGTLFGDWLTPRTLSLGLSGLTALGFVVALAMFQRMLAENDFYHLSRRPLAIGIAGDSGTGKDTLSAALAGLFGERSVASVSGDDYHLFERKSPLWQSLTHLDPRANDLGSFTNDCLSLIDGKAILCRHYDHKTGRFTRRRLIKANDVVLISGLHALYPPPLRARMDAAIFLDMDEELRRHFKIRRDIHVRGHSLERVMTSIERRLADFQRHVAPQRNRADLRFSLRPARPEMVRNADHSVNDDGPVPLRLRVLMTQSTLHDDLHRALVALCGIRVDVGLDGDSLDGDGLDAGRPTVEMVLDGEDVKAEDIRVTAYRLVPHLEDLLAVDPAFKDGMTGLMQLFVLVHLAETSKRKR